MCVSGVCVGVSVCMCVCGVQTVIYFNICFHSDVKRTELSLLLFKSVFSDLVRASLII